MLIICNGMIRSGSTLQYNLVRTFLENLGRGDGHGFFDNKKYIISDEQLKHWAKDRSCHVIKMHDIHPVAIDMAKNNLVAFCYIYRDIRDVAVSVKNIWSPSQERLLSALDKAVNVYYNMKEIPNVLWQKYEDVVNDLPHAVGEVAEFLEIQPKEMEIQAVLRDCSLDKMKEVSKSLKLIAMERVTIIVRSLIPKKLRLFLRKIPVLKGLTFFDNRTLLHPEHISESSGKIGIWQDSLNKNEIDIITNRYKEWLIEAGYRL